MKALKIGDKYLSINNKLLNAPISNSIITVGQNVVMSDNKAVKIWPRVTIGDSSADISVKYGSTTYTLTDASIKTSDGTILSSSGNRTNKSVFVKPGTKITIRTCIKRCDSWAPDASTYIIMNDTNVASTTPDGPYTTYYANYTFTVQKNVKINLHGMVKHQVANHNNHYTLYCTAFITEEE